jgi:hypothetical protein
MADAVTPYRESLFQWVWEKLEFDCRNLRMICGQPVEIRDPGTLNHGAGPDFSGAHIVADGLEWRGSVEIHKSAQEWYHHNHQEDAAYNSVILHVVFCDQNLRGVSTENGSRPFTLCLKPYLHKSLHRLIAMKQKQGIPCGGNVSFISQLAFERQVEAAHRDYFNYKTDEILQAYPAGKPVSEAWKQALLIQVYKTLGIPSNREPMEKLARNLFERTSLPEEKGLFIEKVNAIAFEGKTDSVSWNVSGMRPASRPQSRVEQAAAIHYEVKNCSLRHFLGKPAHSWKHLIGNIAPFRRPGGSRLNLIRQTVYMPSLYLLGKLLHSRQLMSFAFEAWNRSPQQVPQEVQRPFKQAGFDLSGSVKRLGLAHQYKRYCQKQNCHRCEVFKNAIRS